MRDGGKKATNLLLEPTRGTSWSTDDRQAQPASQIGGRSAELDLRALRANGSCGQVSEDEAGIDAMGKTDGTACIQA